MSKCERDLVDRILNYLGKAHGLVVELGISRSRQTRSSNRGPKLYAVRDSKGRFEDIHTYKRAHRTERKRKEKR